jgi:hypothetical protein
MSEVVNSTSVLPDMSDFYYDAQDGYQFVKTDKIFKTTDIASAADGKFYTEEPPDLGYNSQYKVVCVQYYKSNDGIGSYDEQFIDGMKVVDGDTIYFNVDNFKYGDDESKKYIEEITQANLKTANDALGSNPDCHAGVLITRLAFINAAELPHFDAVGTRDSFSSDIDIKTLSYSDVAKSGDYIYSNYKSFMSTDSSAKIPTNFTDKSSMNSYDTKYKDTDTLSFVNVGNKKLRQCFTKNGNLYLLTTQDESQPATIADAGLARDLVVSALHQATEIRIAINLSTLAKSADMAEKVAEYKDSDNILTAITKLYKGFNGDLPRFLSVGFNALGLDAYGRAVCVVYCKVGGIWININKLVICKTPKSTQNTDFTMSDMFDPSSYQYADKVYADNVYSATAKNDDRLVVHGKISKLASIEAMTNWSVLLGDILLLVPPTSINKVNMTKSEYLQPMRARGKMFKNSCKTQELIEMELYFCGDTGINGTPYEVTLNGKKLTYYLDGLRSLIAQFKVCPFLPIQNEFINDVLHIQAVTLSSINISTVPMYPKLLKVNLQLSDFDYRVYMPEIPLEEDGLSDKNYFAEQIYYPLMRYYYQRMIMDGERIKDLEFNSKEYINKASETHDYYVKTCLEPMKFKDSTVRFYVPNKEALDIKKQKKVQQLQDSTTMTFDNTDKELVGEFNKITTALDSFKNSDECKALDTYNKDSNTDYEFYTGGTPVLDYLDEAISYASGGCYLYIVNRESKQIVAVNCDNRIDAAVEKVKSEMQNATTKSGSPLCECIGTTPLTSVISSDGSYVTVGRTVMFKINIDTVGKETSYKKLKDTAATSNSGTITADEIFKDNKISYRIYITLYRNGDYGLGLAVYALQCGTDNAWSYEVETESTKNFLQYCSALGNKSELNQDLTNKNVSATVDWETNDGIEYDLYNDGSNLVVTNCTMSMSNTFTNITLQSTNGIAPQFMGGSEVAINMTITTWDRDVALALENLPSLTATFAREYHIIMSQWGLRMDCELTRFLGVNDVIIDTVHVSTVPNFPNLYQVDMVLYSTDRNLRNREMLKKSEIDNFKNVYTSGQTQVRAWEYSQIDTLLSETELYPDLELPTMKELKDMGFEFLRYSNEKRKYPDPDFYFIYAHVLTSQLIRESVLNSVDIDMDNFDVKSPNEGVDVTNKSSADAEKQMQEEFQLGNTELQETYQTQKNKEAVKNAMTFIAQPENSIEEIWVVCPTIKVALAEKNITNEMTVWSKKDYNQTYEEANKTKYASTTTEENSSTTTTTDTDSYIFNNVQSVKEKVYENIDNYLKNPISESSQQSSSEGDFIFPWSDLCSILKPMGVTTFNDESGTAATTANGMVYAAAAAMTGRQEYNKASKDTRWKPYLRYFEYITSDSKYPVGYYGTASEVSKMKDLLVNEGDSRLKLEQIKCFGPFKMRFYTMVEYCAITDLSVATDENTHTFKDMYLLDPYYTNAEEKVIREYIYNCCTNTTYATTAFFRIVLVWFKKLIRDNIIPSYAFDMLRGVLKDSDNIDTILKSLGVSNASTLSKTYQEYFAKNSKALDKGKLLIAILCALYGSTNNKFYTNLRNRDYTNLGALTNSTFSDNKAPKDNSEKDTLFRKYSLALVGKGVVDNVDLGSAGKGNSDTPFVVDQKERMDEEVVKAGNDPKKYLLHSFYDMVAYDCRGRMLRAFPTYYMVFIDEGRQIGAWKLHDNFYTSASISGITITKSKNIAADTAQVTMSNFFNIYTSDDTEMNYSYINNYSDIIRSIWTPRVQEYAEEAEQIRSQMNSPTERVKLRAGIRMQIRIGYGSDASVIPVMFNGMITDVETNEVVSFIAQGDGAELSKPLLYDKDAIDIQSDNDFFGTYTSSGCTPQNILRSILTSNGSYINTAAKGTEYEYWADAIGTPMNPYGIYHFGEKTFMYFNDMSEPCQNIFECGMARNPAKTKYNFVSEYEADKQLTIDFHLFGKTMWDVMHICQSVHPTYITSIFPFSFRSSIFYGRPHDYCAYAYRQTSNGTLYEKRKPFQQYHIYTSVSDIINNYITTSVSSFNTCCVGVYEMQGSFNSKDVEHTQPVWLDKEIYPEFQRTFYCDTNYYGRGGRTWGAGSAFSDFFLASIFNSSKFDRICDETGQVKSHHAIATRMTVNALKESVQNMYQGAFVVIGDPTVKPYDRIFISDTFNEIQGSVLVRDVVHTLSAEAGFTTTIYPDLVAVPTDNANDEAFIHNWVGCVASTAILYSMQAASNYVTSRIMNALGKDVKSFMKTSEIVSKAGEMTKQLATKAEQQIAKRKMLQQIASKLNVLSKARNVISAGSAAAEVAGTAEAAGATAAEAVGGQVARQLGWGLVRSAATTVLAPIIANPIAAIGLAIATALTVYFVGSALDWLAKEMKNSRALTLFPLKKYGRPLVAGVDGNKSSVYGSVSYNKGDEGPFRNAMNNLYNNYVKDSVMGDAASFLMPETVSALSSYTDSASRNNQSMVDNDLAQKALNRASGSQLNLYQKAELNPQLPRVDMTNKADKERIIKSIGIQGNTVDAINADMKMKDMKPVIKSIALKQYINNEFFVVIHESPNFNTELSENITPIALNIGGTKPMQVNALKSKTSTTNKDVYDIPFLHQSALNVLEELIKAAYNNVEETYNDVDKIELKKKMAQTQIALTSALKAGSDKNYECTGLSFTLRCTNDTAYKGLCAAITTIDNNFAEAKKVHSSYTDTPFYTKKDDANKQVFITVKMLG